MVDPRLKRSHQRGHAVIRTRQIVSCGLRFAQSAVEQIAAHERRLIPGGKRADVGGAVLLRERSGRQRG